MTQSRKIADREQRVARLGPFSMGEWVLLVGPMLLVTTVAKPPIYLVILLFCLDAGFILGVLRSFPPGSFKDWVRLQWDYARFGPSVFTPFATDTSLRHGDHFLAQRSKIVTVSLGLLALTVAGLLAMYWVIFRL